jgi:hypothetical protein
MLGGDINDTGAGTRTDNTRKYSSIVGYHYSNEEQPIGIISYDCQSDSVAVINYGIPSTSYNAPTVHKWFTASNATTTTGTERMRITDDGVIIGPGLSSLYFGDGDTGFYESGDDTFNVKVGGSLQFTFDGDSMRAPTTGGADIRNVAGSQSAPAFTFNDDTNTGMYRAAADTLAFTTGGSECMRIYSDGSLYNTNGSAHPTNDPYYRVFNASGSSTCDTTVTVDIPSNASSVNGFISVSHGHQQTYYSSMAIYAVSTYGSYTGSNFSVYTVYSQVGSGVGGFTISRPTSSVIRVVFGTSTAPYGKRWMVHAWGNL